MFSTLYFVDEILETYLKRDEMNIKKTTERAG